MTKANLKEEAIKLRNQGYSYNKIMENLPVSKGILSLWLRDIDVSNIPAYKNLRAEALKYARDQGAIINKQRAQEL